jgi:hypothetical protein
LAEPHIPQNTFLKKKKHFYWGLWLGHPVWNRYAGSRVPHCGGYFPRWRKDIKEAFKQFLFISVLGIALLVRHYIFFKKSKLNSKSLLNLKKRKLISSLTYIWPPAH